GHALRGSPAEAPAALLHLSPSPRRRRLRPLLELRRRKWIPRRLPPPPGRGVPGWPGSLDRRADALRRPVRLSLGGSLGPSSGSGRVEHPIRCKDGIERGPPSEPPAGGAAVPRHPVGRPPQSVGGCPRGTLRPH